MATRRFGLSRGETFGNVTEAVGAAVATDDVEITVDLANLSTASGRLKVLEAIEILKQYITTVQWPPA